MSAARDLRNGDKITFGRVDAIYCTSEGTPTVTEGDWSRRADSPGRFILVSGCPRAISECRGAHGACHTAAAGFENAVDVAVAADFQRRRDRPSCGTPRRGTWRIDRRSLGCSGENDVTARVARKRTKTWSHWPTPRTGKNHVVGALKEQPRHRRRRSGRGRGLPLPGDRRAGTCLLHRPLVANYVDNPGRTLDHGYDLGQQIVHDDLRGHGHGIRRPELGRRNDYSLVLGGSAAAREDQHYDYARNRAIRAHAPKSTRVRAAAPYGVVRARHDAGGQW